MTTNAKMTVGEVCRSAKMLLERDGWCQGKRHDADGRRCIMGAIYDAVADDLPYMGDVLLEVSKAARAVIELSGWYCLVGWNDYPRRTMADVLEVLDKTAARSDN